MKTNRPSDELMKSGSIPPKWYGAETGYYRPYNDDEPIDLNSDPATWPERPRGIYHGIEIRDNEPGLLARLLLGQGPNTYALRSQLPAILAALQQIPGVDLKELENGADMLEFGWPVGPKELEKGYLSSQRRAAIDAALFGKPKTEPRKTLKKHSQQESTMNDAYIQGFIQKCAEAGIDPVKLAQYGGGSPMNQTAASLMRAGVMGGIPGALTAGQDRRTAGAAAGTLAQGLAESIGKVGIEALLPKLQAMAKTSPDLARNLANILDLTNQLGSVTAGAGAGRLVGKLAPAAEA